MKILSAIVSTLGLLTLFSCDGTCQTKRYENIIAEIKKHELLIGKLEKYKIEKFSNISTIKKLHDNYQSERGKRKGCIWVFKTKDNLLIFIETEDNGHAGEYGIVYSEAGQPPIWNVDEWGEFWTVAENINGNWWKISFRLG